MAEQTPGTDDGSKDPAQRRCAEEDLKGDEEDAEAINRHTGYEARHQQLGGRVAVLSSGFESIGPLHAGRVLCVVKVPKDIQARGCPWERWVFTFDIESA